MISNIRNFVIISHIDHGKSTLADRFLELCEAIPKDKLKAQFLDSMDLEKEKGITIKMHPVRIIYNLLKEKYIFNLIDTPGHIDFRYEISRALACVEGALLLVDATKGIQAQTLFNLQQARDKGLVIIPAVNKIDLPYALVEETKKEIAEVLEISEQDVFCVSGKTGQGVEDLIKALVQKIPPPKSFYQKTSLSSQTSRPEALALIFDSKYDSFSGVISYVRVFNGEFRKAQKINFLATKASAEIKEVGFFMPEFRQCDVLKTGDIGYIKTRIKDTTKIKAGDTISDTPDVLPLVGYIEPQPVLFLSLYPEDSDDFELLKNGLEKLKLNDAALDFTAESKTSLGRGFRVGFLGSLHAEITIRRLKSEFGLELIATSPQVKFLVITKNKKQLYISSPSNWPDAVTIEEVREPWILLEILTPNIYLGEIINLLRSFNANLIETKTVSGEKSILFAESPLREIINGDFYDKIKSSTQGYASFGFKPIGYRVGDLVKLDILIAGEIQKPFSRIVLRENAFYEGKKFLQKLKNSLSKQQFAVSLQAVVSGKIIARETISAKRKDVTGALYGGDVTRKRKLLDIQKKGKKELKAKGRVHISAEEFLKIVKN